ncbi:MAG TPA: SRPBCC family protein [Thermoleophilia bacterium]|nr:SRPBCC family protein [Thermoleophilia bacterium]
MDINRTAPVIALAKLQIGADRQTVWETLTDFGSRPAWKRGVRSMALNGPVARGSTFEWKAGPGTIRSRLQEVETPHRIAWTGVTLGVRAVDVFRLEARDGGTLVIEEESWQGLLPRLFRSRMRRTLQSSSEGGLQSLRIEAERRARTRAAA